MRRLVLMISCALLGSAHAQVNKRSDTYIQQDVGLDVTTMLAIPRTDNLGGLFGFTGAPIYFNPTNGRIHAHNGTSWIPFPRWDEVVNNSANQTINGQKTFSQPVKGAGATADGEYVTREQVLPIATSGSGIVRMLSAPSSGIFNGSAANVGEYLKIGNTVTEYSMEIPAGTIAGNTTIEVDFTTEMTTTSPSSANTASLFLRVLQGSTVLGSIRISDWLPLEDNRDGSNSITQFGKVTIVHRGSGVLYMDSNYSKNVFLHLWGPPSGGGGNVVLNYRLTSPKSQNSGATFNPSLPLTLKLYKNVTPASPISGLGVSVFPFTVRMSQL